MAPRGRPARTALRWRQPSRSSSASGGVPRRRGRATDGATDGTHPCGCPPGRSACADHRSRSTAAGGPGLSPRRPVVESRRMSPPAPVSARQLRWPRSAVGIAPTLREGLGETTRPCNTVVSKYRGPGSQQGQVEVSQLQPISWASTRLTALVPYPGWTAFIRAGLLPDERAALHRIAGGSRAAQDRRPSPHRSPPVQTELAGPPLAPNPGQAHRPAAGRPSAPPRPTGGLAGRGCRCPASG